MLFTYPFRPCTASSSELQHDKVQSHWCSTGLTVGDSDPGSVSIWLVFEPATPGSIRLCMPVCRVTMDIALESCHYYCLHGWHSNMGSADCSKVRSL